MILLYFPILVNPLLHTEMAVEKLGGWQDPCSDDGPGHRSGPG